MGNEVYLNGVFIPKAEAKVSVMDRGFLFGDGVYEVIPCYGGHLFRVEQHLARLNKSLNAIRMTNPLSEAQWLEILSILIDQLPSQDQSVYLQITRGSDAHRDHEVPKQVKPTIFAMTTGMSPADPTIASHGIKAITLQDNRWLRCNIKTTSLLANVLLKDDAREQGAMEAILIRDDQATEGAASNLFIVSNGTLMTPAASDHLLPGITRDLILELAQGAGIDSKSASISETQLLSAEEVWLSSSTKEIMPVVELNGAPVGNGKPGPIFKQLHALYSHHKQLLQNGKIEP